MRDKLKDKFLPSYYLQDNYLKLQHLKQDSKSVESTLGSLNNSS